MGDRGGLASLCGCAWAARSVSSHKIAVALSTARKRNVLFSRFLPAAGGNGIRWVSCGGSVGGSRLRVRTVQKRRCGGAGDATVRDGTLFGHSLARTRTCLDVELNRKLVACIVHQLHAANLRELHAVARVHFAQLRAD